MKLLLMLLEIEEDSIVRWPFETVAVGIADLTEIFRGWHAGIWVLGMGCLYIQSAINSSRQIFDSYRPWIWSSNSTEVLSQAAIESNPILRLDIVGRKHEEVIGWQIAVLMPETTA
jgi:hypothetical protein